MPHRASGAPTQYFSPDPQVASAPTTVTLTLPDLTFTLTTDRGVFSADHVDPGTRLLLMEAPPLPAGPVDVVDVGCGYGPIALTMALRAPEATVWAVDVNERARDLCRTNAETLGVGDRVRVCVPEEVPDDLRVAAVWSNPPIRIGKTALHEILGSWTARLLPDGAAILVVHKHLGSDSLVTWLTDRGHRVERLRSRSGYRLLKVEVAPS